jgi:hypothetical protein
MALKPIHVSMIGVGVSAIGVIAMILYYRHSQNAAQTASPDTGMGSFPYFQTAAVPGGGGGDGTTVAAAPAAAPLDVGALVTALQAGQASSDAASAQTSQAMNFSSEFASVAQTLLSQQATELSNIPGGIGTPLALTAFATPTPGGGFSFGTAAAPAQIGLPNALTFLYGGQNTGTAFFNPNADNPNINNHASNSTNSTPVSNTVH